MEILEPDKSAVQRILPFTLKTDKKNNTESSATNSRYINYSFSHNKNLAKTQAAIQKSFPFQLTRIPNNLSYRNHHLQPLSIPPFFIILKSWRKKSTIQYSGDIFPYIINILQILFCICKGQGLLFYSNAM
jgi:hypothetical protein